MRIFFQPQNVGALSDAEEAQRAPGGSAATLNENEPPIREHSSLATGGSITLSQLIRRSPAMEEIARMHSALSGIRTRGSRFRSPCLIPSASEEDDEILPDYLCYPDDPMVDEPPLAMAVVLALRSQENRLQSQTDTAPTVDVVI